jgi:hypothetical protein
VLKGSKRGAFVVFEDLWTLARGAARNRSWPAICSEERHRMQKQLQVWKKTAVKSLSLFPHLTFQCPRWIGPPPATHMQALLRASKSAGLRGQVKASSINPLYPSSNAPLLHHYQQHQQQQSRSMILRATTAAKGTGPLWEGQNSLPPLPVPALEQTFQKYLRTTLPHAKAAVESALSGSDAEIFKKLQERLLQRAKDPESDNNWLAAWWNDAAYMGYRDPVVPYVSYFYVNQDDKSRRTGPKRAASQIKGVLQFRKLIETEQLSPDKNKSGPMCSASYPWMFNSVRIPVSPNDQAVKYDSTKNNHLVVARNGHFFEFDLYENGQELSASEIER